jgi:DNA repair exonuclease SbcCD nuclease subunit
MGRLAFIFRTDVHACDKDHRPASWKADYFGEITESLRQVGAMAKDHGAVAVIDGGDFFHKKAPTRNSHALVEHTVQIHKAYPCPVWEVEGNHDITNNDLASVEHQPLGVLYACGIFGQLREQVFKDQGLQVRVVGVPYDPKRKLEDLQAIKKQPGDTHLVAIVHSLAGLKPPASTEDFFGEPVFDYDDLAGIQDGPEAWCFGHWHKDQGIEEINGRQFINHGSVSRGALVRENLERTPKVGLIEIDLDGLRASSLLLNVAPAEEVFDMERKERTDREGKEIEAFVTRLSEQLTVDPGASIEEAIGSIGFAMDIQTLAREYIERARAGIG